MKPLLNIQSIPISIECQMNRASLEYQRPKPEVNITRNRGRSEIQSNPARVKMDSFESRASMGLKSARRSLQDFAGISRSAAVEAVGNLVQEGNRLAQNYISADGIAENAQAKMMRTTQYDANLSYIPSVGPQISVEGGSVSFDFTMDQLQFDWNVQVRPQMEYMPGGVTFSVQQYPEVIIEYIGTPFYVPPSADPNYDPPLILNATA